MIEHLKPIEFAVLHGVAAHVNLSKEGKVLYEGKLTYFSDVVELNLQET